MFREGQARQGCLSVCAQGLCKDAKPTKHTQTLTLRIFLQFITTAYKLQTPDLAYKHFAGFAKCRKSPSSLAPHQPFQNLSPLSKPRLTYFLQKIFQKPLDKCRSIGYNKINKSVNVTDFTNNNKKIKILSL